VHFVEDEPQNFRHATYSPLCLDAFYAVILTRDRSGATPAAASLGAARSSVFGEGEVDSASGFSSVAPDGPIRPLTSRGKPAARGIAGKASSSDARGWPAYAADDDASPHERHGGAYASPCARSLRRQVLNS
jgi:hypothetical protein